MTVNKDQNERGKICPRCNTAFECCIENCWCSQLPQIMPLPDNGDCYCPACLETIIREKEKEFEAKEK